MNGPNPLGIILLIGMMIWAFCILAKKHRGFGYYLLAFLFPLIGLIVAACLKKKSKIITSYRKADAQKWEQDVNDVIKTFKWVNPK